MHCYFFPFLYTSVFRTDWMTVWNTQMYGLKTCVSRKRVPPAEAPDGGQHSPPSTLGMDVRVEKMVCTNSLLAATLSVQLPKLPVQLQSQQRCVLGYAWYIPAENSRNWPIAFLTCFCDLLSVKNPPVCDFLFLPSSLMTYVPCKLASPASLNWCPSWGRSSQHCQSLLGCCVHFWPGLTWGVCSPHPCTERGAFCPSGAIGTGLSRSAIADRHQAPF